MKRKYSRRDFVKQNSVIGLGAAMQFGLSSSFYEKFIGGGGNPAHIDRIENEIILHGRRNNQAWFEPAIGVIPGNKKRLPQVFARATLLSGNDIGPQLYMKTDNLGKSWSNPILCQNWFKVPLNDNVYEEPWFGFFYHKMTNKFIAIGHTHFVQDEGTGTSYKNTSYKNERHYRSPDLKGSIVCSLWDPSKADFEPWVRMKLSEKIDLGIYYNGQFHEKDDGTILIPGYYRGSLKEEESSDYSKVTVIRCKFNGTDLQYIEHGSIHSVEEARGLAEPSLVYFGGKYYLTVRHDLRGYVTSGEDGLHFDELKTWRFDDGEDLGNYNTQQKWLKQNDVLHLIYNRKSELNNGVFRSRAPLFMAEVDTDRLMIRRNTERIVFPEKGARMGNFNTVNVTDNESWIISGEWLEGMFSHSKKGDRFWVDSSSINYVQYIGDLLLARVSWK
jgi:hypothetical protein